MSRHIDTAAPQIGERAVIPAQATGTLPDGRELPRVHTGRVVYVNEPHRWFLVTADVGGTVIREGFKF